MTPLKVVTSQVKNKKTVFTLFYMLCDLSASDFPNELNVLCKLNFYKLNFKALNGQCLQSNLLHFTDWIF